MSTNNQNTEKRYAVLQEDEDVMNAHIRAYAHSAYAEALTDLRVQYGRDEEREQYLRNIRDLFLSGVEEES